LLVTFAITALGSFGDAASTGLYVLIAFRFITGMGVGADLNLVSTYIGELAPPKIRGRITLYTFVVGILGQAVSPFIALALVPNFTVGWRMLFVIGGIIASVGLVMRTRLPESPRWEVRHGYMDDAEETVARMERHCQETGVDLPEPEYAEVPEPKGFSVRFLFQPPFRRRLAVLIPMWLLWYIGNYGFLGDAPQLLKQHGAKHLYILYLGIGSIGYPVGALCMTFLVDRVERKLLMFGATIVWLVGMLLLGTLANDVIIYIGTFLGALALGAYLQVAYTFTAENFPTRARPTGFAFADGIGHAGGAAGAILLPALVSAWSFFWGFTFIGCTGALAGILALLGPAVTGKNLEEVSQ
jgi:MFS family permease